MLSANPNLTVAQVRDILRATAVDWGAAGQDVDYGWGRLDGYAAVKRAGSFTGTLSSGSAVHTFTVTDTTYPVAVTLIMPGWTGSSTSDIEKTGPEVKGNKKAPVT